MDQDAAWHVQYSMTYIVLVPYWHAALAQHKLHAETWRGLEMQLLRNITLSSSVFKQTAVLAHAKH